MIQSITLSGFKSLKRLSFDLGKLNILVGANASGKSSFLQALLLLRQSSTPEGLIRSLQLSGDLFEGGTATDILHPEAERKIDVDITESDTLSAFQFEALRSEADPNPRVLAARSTLPRLPVQLFERGNRFSYLNAERIGPRVNYPLSPNEAKLSGILGKHGEFTTAYLARAHASSAKVAGWDDRLELLTFSPTKNIDLADIELAQSQLVSVANLLLAWVIPGATFDASEHAAMDMAQLGFTRDATGTKASVRPTHIGFGLSYVLPIIAAMLSTDAAGTLIVENPEAHLHPFSQSRIGSLLGLAAKNGMQTFVESHSDHLVNGVRLAVKNKLIAATDVRFFFFEKNPDSDSSGVTTLMVEEDGSLSDWPAGFFDQIENDLARL